MKSFISILLLSSSLFCQSGSWILTKTPVDANLKLIHAIDSLNIWVAGDSGYILYSSDNGNNWSIQNFRPNYQINDLFFLNSKNGWAIESGSSDGNIVDNFILTTSDGGLNWQSKRFRPDNIILNTICFVNDTFGIVGGDNSIFHYTTNGGIDWNEIQRDTATFSHFPVRKVRFINDTVGVAVGGIFDRGGVIWHCTDGGFIWMTDSAYADPFFDMAFIDSNTIIALASDIERSFPSAVFKTTNLGTSWFYREIPFYGVSLGIYARTSQEIWGTFGQEFIMSSDRGENWQTFTTPDSISVFDITFIDSLNGYAVGQNGKLLKYRYIISSVENAQHFNEGYFKIYPNYPNPFNSETNIKFELFEESFVQLSLYNVLGEKLLNLYEGIVNKGTNELSFNFNNLNSGVYFISIEIKSTVKTFTKSRAIQKIILSK